MTTLCKHHPLGSSSLELDQNAAIISYEEYHPFGTTSYRSGRTETEVSLKRYKYVGKERDEESGLYYYGARYYTAWLGRFVSVDPLAGERSWVNPYNYVQNNPINRIDPTGALDDHYFDEETGEYLGNDGAKTNNIRTISLKDWNSIDHNSPNKMKLLQCEGLLISESSITGETYAKIGNYFYSNRSNGLGFNIEELYNSSTSTPTHNIPPGFKERLDAVMSAYTKHGAIVVYAKYDNAYNFMNDFVHERHHNKNDVGENVHAYRHLNAYNEQISHATWQNTTETFKNNTVKNIGYYLFQVSTWGDGWKPYYDERLKYFQNKLNVNFDFTAMQEYYITASGRYAPVSNIKYTNRDE